MPDYSKRVIIIIDLQAPGTCIVARYRYKYRYRYS